MTNSCPTIIGVRYEFREGLHTFSSDEFKGLFIANQDPARAYDAVAPALVKLMKLNYDLDCVAEPSMTYPEFVRQHEHRSQLQRSPSYSSRNFVLRPAA